MSRRDNPVHSPGSASRCGLLIALLAVAAAPLTAQTASEESEREGASVREGAAQPPAEGGANPVAASGSTDDGSSAARFAVAETIGIDEIERGQRGYGLSVFAGTEPERFELEVVGVLRNLNPGTSFILARLSGHGLEESGVAGGMSGSPVYIGERLAGAVAFSWSFSNGALAGITPIDLMRELHRSSPLLADPAGPGGSMDSLDGGEEASRVGPRSVLPQGLGAPRPEDLLRRGDGAERFAAALDELAALLPSLPHEGARYGYQLVTSGFSGRAAELAERQFAATGVAAASGGRIDEDRELPPLGAGSTVIGVLVGGDLQMAVSGTVTERQGDDVLAFGHPFLGIGELDIPMAGGEVVTVVSSVASSFKLTNTGPIVGSLRQDRLAGITGRVGATPETTPMRIEVRRAEAAGDSALRRQRFDLELADLPAMRPGLIGVSLLQSLESAERIAGEQSVDLRARIEIEGQPTLEIEQNFDGTGAAFDAAVYLLQVSGFLELNPWRDVTIEAIDVELEVAEQGLAHRLLDAFPSRRVVRPGETLTVHLELEAVRGARSRHRVEVPIPSGLDSGRYYLFVGDGPSTDAVKLQVAPRDPKSFEATLHQLDDFRSSRDLVVLGVRGAGGITYDGRVLSDLPPSVRALWESARRSEIRRTALVLEQETVRRWHTPLDGVVRIDLEVRRGDEDDEELDAGDAGAADAVAAEPASGGAAPGGGAPEPQGGTAR
ncbi:MAG: hypothetical protein DWQ36_11580 [Acidobacteria bacterium]|nr:MAG: hypothetical protein DWQ30_18140 [Acidobacteriota bacterium]REK07842.1 MAG: hypothetical protein DWQ36_11580 [Acidobacteriota bacterium]